MYDSIDIFILRTQSLFYPQFSLWKFLSLGYHFDSRLFCCQFFRNFCNPVQCPSKVFAEVNDVFGGGLKSIGNEDIIPIGVSQHVNNFGTFWGLKVLLLAHRCGWSFWWLCCSFSLCFEQLALNSSLEDTNLINNLVQHRTVVCKKHCTSWPLMWILKSYTLLFRFISFNLKFRDWFDSLNTFWVGIRLQMDWFVLIATCWFDHLRGITWNKV